jgi:hypothetical protein
MAIVGDIGRAPHPIGSAEHARVREAVRARLRGLGLRAWTVPGTAVRKTADGFVGADVENVVGVLPGWNPGLPAVLLMAHYDSVAGSPAAADDGAGVASVLETVRAIASRGRAPRDLVVLITDGEETGLFGAQAAFRDGVGDYDLKRIGAVVNLETRGSSGPAFMFETGRRNAGVIDRYARAVAHPAANSLTSWVYDRMPNGSDFTVPKTLGLPGVNIAMIGRPFDYHSPSATPDNLDRRSLQHMGEQTLAMADAFLKDGPGARGGDRVYADAFGRRLIAYPAWVGWGVLAVAAGLSIFAMNRRGMARPVELLRGAGLFVLLIAWPALVLHLGWRLAPVGPDFYQSRTVAQFGLYFAGNALLAAGMAMTAFGLAARGTGRWWLTGAAVLAGLVCSVRGGFDAEGAALGVAAAALSAFVIGREMEPRGMVQGLRLAALFLAGALQVAAPGPAFLIAWPLLGACLVAAVLAAREDGIVRDLVAVVVGAVFLGWLLRMAGPLFDGLGITSPELLGLFTGLSALILAPFLLGWIGWGKGGHWAAMACNISGIGLIAYVALHQPWSARTPQPSHVLYIADQATGRARVASVGGGLDPWSRGVLEAYGPVREGEIPALFADRAWWADAGPAGLTVPTPWAGWDYPHDTGVEPANRDFLRDWDAHLASGESPRIVVNTPSGARDVRVTFEFSSDVSVIDDEVSPPGGRPIVLAHAAASKPYRVRWYGRSTPVRLAVRPASAHGSVRVRWAALRDGWPAWTKPLPPRPANVMRMNSSDATVVTGEQTLRW